MNKPTQYKRLDALSVVLLSLIVSILGSGLILAYYGVEKALSDRTGTIVAVAVFVLSLFGLLHYFLPAIRGYWRLLLLPSSILLVYMILFALVYLRTPNLDKLGDLTGMFYYLSSFLSRIEAVIRSLPTGVKWQASFFSLREISAEVGILLWFLAISFYVTWETLGDLRQSFGKRRGYLFGIWIACWLLVWIYTLINVRLSLLGINYDDFLAYQIIEVILPLVLILLLSWLLTPFVQGQIGKRHFPTWIVASGLLYAAFEFWLFSAAASNPTLTRFALSGRYLSQLRRNISLSQSTSTFSYDFVIAWGGYAFLISSLWLLCALLLGIVWAQERRTFFANLIRRWRWASAATLACLLLFATSHSTGILAAGIQSLNTELPLPPLPRIHLNLIATLVEDNSEKMWAGGLDGVYHYNASKQIWEKQGEGLPDSSGVYALVADKNGQMWAGTLSGVYQFNTSRLIWEKQSQGLPNEAAVYTLLADRNSQMWAGIGNGGVYLYNTSKQVWEKHSQGLPDSTWVYALLGDENGQMWTGLENTGVYLYNTSKQVWEKHSQGLPDPITVYALFADKNGRIWAGSESAGVYLYNASNQVWESQSAGLFGQGAVRDFEDGDDGKLWIGLDTGGVYSYDSKGKLWVARKAGLPEHARIWTLLKDHEGQLWTGLVSGGGGIYRYDHDNDTWVSQSSGLPDQVFVKTLLVDRRGLLWSGLSLGSGGAYQYNSRLGRWESQSAGLPEIPYVTAQALDNNGQIWAGLRTGGVYYYSEIGQVWENQSEGLPNSLGVYALLGNENGQMWAGLENGGIYRYNASKQIWEKQSQGLPDQMTVNALLADKNGQMWAGTIGGVYHYSALEQAWEQRSQGLPDPVVNALGANKNGQILAGLGNGGVYHYNASKQLWEKQSQGLPDQVYVNALSTNKNGQMWTGTDGGVYHYNASKQIWEKQSQGLPGQVKVYALLADKNGQMWAGTFSGIYRYNTTIRKWESRSEFVELPSLIDRPDNDLIVGFDNFSPLQFHVDTYPRVWDKGADLNKYIGNVKLHRANDGVGLASNSREVFVSDITSDGMFRFAEGQLWFSQDGGFWNPVANTEQVPLGAATREGKRVTLWMYSNKNNKDMIEEYTFELPWYVRSHLFAIVFAIGRSPTFARIFIASAIIYYLYLSLIYLLAGRTNEIFLRQFLYLDWTTPNLLGRLLSRGKDGYTALRLTVHRLNDLHQLLFLFMKPPNSYSPKELIEVLQKHSVSPTINDVEDGLLLLTRTGLVEPLNDHYIHAEPDLASIYQRIYEELDQESLIEAVRKRDPVTIDACQFFEQAGFLITTQYENSIVLQPQRRTRLNQITGQILAYLLPNQELHSGDVRAIAEKLEKEKDGKGNLDEHIVFIVINKPADMAAYAQMDSYRWGEGLIFIPLTHQRLRTALTEGVCEMELNAVLNEYLAENPDLYNQRNPVRDEHYFGRNKDQEVLLSYPKQGQPLGIFALNKMGKTSFVNHLAELMTDRAVVVVDLQKVAKNARAVYTSLVSGLVKDIAQKWHTTEFSGLHLIQQESVPDDLAADFVHDLEELHRILAAHTPEPRFVVFIDEIDRLIPGEDADLAAGFEGYNDLLSTLRGVSQTGLPLTFVVIGVQPYINRKAQLAGTENAGFSIFEEYFLPPLERAECDLMVSTIGRKMGLNYSEAALVRLYYESGGHPFLARQLCSLAWKQSGVTRGQGGLLELDEDHILQAVSAFLYDRGRSAYYKELYQTRLSNEEQKVVLRLAAADGPVASQKGELAILSDLSLRHIVFQRDQKFQLAYGMLRRWLRREVLELENEE